jgi:uncharacterized membrane protein YeaQ/YmgE (transglycosylase-associated protein family)
MSKRFGLPDMGHNRLIITVICGIFGAIVGALTIYNFGRSDESKLSELQRRIDKLEASVASDLSTLDSKLSQATLGMNENRATEYEKRLTTVESGVSRIAKDIGAIRADVGRVDSNASGLGENLASRVAALESSNLTELKGGGEGAAGISNSAGSKRAVIVQQDFSKNLKTVMVGPIAVGIVGCFRKGITVTCSGLAKNQDNPANIFFSAERSRIFTPAGNAFKAAKIIVGDKNSENGVDFEMPTDVPVNFEVEFRNIPDAEKGFSLIQFHIDLKNAEFRGVPIEG